MGEIAESDCFHNFLMTSVQALKRANHVVPNPQKTVKRRSFLGIVKAPVTEDVLKAEVSFDSYILLPNLTHHEFIHVAQILLISCNTIHLQGTDRTMTTSCSHHAGYYYCSQHIILLLFLS